jgi:hypothetical protein
MRFLSIAVLMIASMHFAGCNQKPISKMPTINAGDVRHYSQMGVYQEFISDGFYIVRSPKGELVALDTAIARLNCRAVWLPEQGKFQNVCTNGFYSLTESMRRAQIHLR